jgi:hypothetical protein
MVKKESFKGLWILIVIIVILFFSILYYLEVKEPKKPQLLDRRFFEQSLENIFENCTHEYCDDFCNDVDESIDLEYDCPDNQYFLSFSSHKLNDKVSCCRQIGGSEENKLEKYKGYSLCISLRESTVAINDLEYVFYLSSKTKTSEEFIKNLAISIANELNINDGEFDFENCPI